MAKKYDELENLRIQIEKTRTQLNEMLKNRKDTLDKEVLKLSERLDQLLLDFIKKSKD